MNPRTSAQDSAHSSKDGNTIVKVIHESTNLSARECPHLSLVLNNYVALPFITIVFLYLLHVQLATKIGQALPFVLNNYCVPIFTTVFLRHSSLSVALRFVDSCITFTIVFPSLLLCSYLYYR